MPKGSKPFSQSLVEDALRSGVWYSSEINLGTGMCDCVWGYASSAEHARNIAQGLRSQGFKVEQQPHPIPYNLKKRTEAPPRPGDSPEDFVDIYYVRIEKPGGGHGGNNPVNIREWPFNVEGLKLFNRNPRPIPGHTGEYPQQTKQFAEALFEMARIKKITKRVGSLPFQ